MSPEDPATADRPRPLDYCEPATRPPARGRRVLTWVAVSTIALLLLVAAMLPDLCSAREPANRVKCRSNLSQIGKAIYIYQKEHRAGFPDSFADLWDTDVNTEVFTCPSSNDEKAIGPATQAFKDVVNKPGCCSYVYLGKGLALSAPSDTLVAYEKEDNHSKDGMNLLFADGAVQWYKLVDAKAIIARRSR